MNTLLVSYVILTRNRCSEVLDCLHNVQQQDYPQKDVVLVDNGSTDGTVQKVRNLFPAVKVIRLDHNVGVSAGRNRGIEATKGEICIVIDDDARFAHPDATRRVMLYFQREQIACISFRIKNGTTGLEDRKALPTSHKRIMEDDRPVAYFCGAGFAIRRRVFLEMGCFWEPLIYGCEELDLSYRLVNAGYEVVYAASVQVIHYEVPIARPKGQWVYHQVRNRCWVAVKNLPWRFALSTTLLWWIYSARVALQHGELPSYFSGVRDALIGLPRVLQSRQPIKNPVIARIKKLAGRLWY
jgi:GT2 family glycosyltransferase